MYIQRAGYYGQKLVDGEACQAKDPNACGCSYCTDMIMQQQLFKVATQLKKTAFKANVMRECQELFLDEQFTKKVDENRTLLACANGVFDMDRCEFRDGRQEDYVSFLTNLEYDPDRSYKEYREWKEDDCIPPQDLSRSSECVITRGRHLARCPERYTVTRNPIRGRA